MVLLKFVQLLVKVFESVFCIVPIYYVFKKREKSPAVTDKLLLYPARTLSKMISQKQITSEQVMKAYIIRIKQVNPIINAVVEDNFELAIEEAKNIDSMINTSNLTPEQLLNRYPLLGLPLSVKESIAVAGCSHGAGKVFSETRVAIKDAPVVELCKDAGAIPFVISNTPELSANFETDNNVTGRTVNPYDNRRTVGGSSGGEGALLGAAASLIGLGSDIFGSLRLPAHFCGVWSHKPSAKAVNVEGHYPASKHAEEWKEVFNLGPMTRYSTDLSLLLNVLVENDYRPLLKLNEKVDLSTIKFYYIIDKMSMYNSNLHSDVKLHMERLVHYLQCAYPNSVEKVERKLFKHATQSSVITVINYDDVEGVLVNKGKSYLKEIFKYVTCQSSSTFIIVIMHVLKRLVSALPSRIITKSINDVKILKNELVEFLGSDGVLLMPCHPSAAHYHHQMFRYLLDYSLLGIFNVLGLPVTNCPLGLNDQGLPIGVQVVAAPNNDRLTLAVAEEIEKVFGGWIPPSS